MHSHEKGTSSQHAAKRFLSKALAKRLDICTEHALDKCPVQNVASFCHLVQSCSVVFSDVESYSVDFEGSQKCSVDKNVQWTMFTRFATPLNIVQLAQAHCKCNSGQRTVFWCHFNSPYLLRPDLIEGEFGNQKKEMESELSQKQAKKWSNSDVSLHCFTHFLVFPRFFLGSSSSTASIMLKTKATFSYDP